MAGMIAVLEQANVLGHSRASRSLPLRYRLIARRTSLEKGCPNGIRRGTVPCARLGKSGHASKGGMSSLDPFPFRHSRASRSLPLRYRLIASRTSLDNGCPNGNLRGPVPCARYSKSEHPFPRRRVFPRSGYHSSFAGKRKLAPPVPSHCKTCLAQEWMPKRHSEGHSPLCPPW